MKFFLETADEVITQQTLEAFEVKFFLYTIFWIRQAVNEKFHLSTL